MDALAVVDRITLRAGGREISGRLEVGSLVAVLSPQDATALRFLEALALDDRVFRYGRFATPATDFAPRMTVQAAVAKAGDLAVTRIEVSEALVLAGVDGIRRQHAREHKGPRLELAQAVTNRADLMILPYSLDTLTPWELEPVLAAVRGDRSVLVATRRLDVLELADTVIVLHEDQLAFWGSLDQLRRAVLPPTYRLVAKDASAARGIVESFRVQMTETPDGWVFRSEHGQEIAAKLLTQGYGRIEAVIERLPSLKDVLQAVIEHAERGVPLGRKSRPSGII
ncbi:MAG: hypothetical protein JNJ45_00880 [Chthonomonas sp.]|nr:hypothetical protein [Chthonomonas sp.]